MAAPIADGTDVWVIVPASPPLRLTIRACLDDRCRECGLPVYRCESEGGQVLSLCASHLRVRELIYRQAMRPTGHTARSDGADHVVRLQ